MTSRSFFALASWPRGVSAVFSQRGGVLVGTFRLKALARGLSGILRSDLAEQIVTGTGRLCQAGGCK